MKICSQDCKNEARFVIVHRSKKRAWLLCPYHFNWYKKNIDDSPNFAIDYCEEDKRLKLFFTGKFAFRIHSQEGYDIDLLRLWADCRGMGVDMKGFNKEMSKHKNKSISSKFL